MPQQRHIISELLQFREWCRARQSEAEGTDRWRVWRPSESDSSVHSSASDRCDDTSSLVPGMTSLLQLCHIPLPEHQESLQHKFTLLVRFLALQKLHKRCNTELHSAVQRWMQKERDYRVTFFGWDQSCWVSFKALNTVGRKNIWLVKILCHIFQNVHFQKTD